jgi:hypothetical protein
MPPPVNPAKSGYFRWPALHRDTLVFVCEDDLHTVPLTGGVPRRITDAPGSTSKPVFSGCGTYVAFTVTELECEELYVVHHKGGPVVRVTHVRISCFTTFRILIAHTRLKFFFYSLRFARHRRFGGAFLRHGNDRGYKEKRRRDLQGQLHVPI